ncbi:MAG: NADP-dependent isocitrate dehydrogenase [Phycisphaerales bacterium]|nr:NADP-dependent isocitrate dehydrogenase [Phycisphaerales bacterium]
MSELNGVQGHAMDIGGYSQPDPEKTARAMRPCRMLNEIIDRVAVTG